MIHIELIEGCNFKCYFCDARDLTKNIYIDPDMFKRIIDEAKQLGITSVSLTPSRGEPFLHPNIYELLEYACVRMQRVYITTNATAIDVAKLKSISRSTLILWVSFYGDNPAKFIELTRTNEHLFTVFHQKLQALQDANIPILIGRRDQGYQFIYDDADRAPIPPFDLAVKCPAHQNPRIFATGKVAFCNTIREDVSDSDDVCFADVSTSSLRDVLTHPLRYKFFDSQSICASKCKMHHELCINKCTMATVKLMAISKSNYLNDKPSVDGEYLRIEQSLRVP